MTDYLQDYREFVEGIDRDAYHEGEWRWEEDGYTVTRTYHYSPPGCHDSCGVLLYTKDGKLEKVEGDPLSAYAGGKLCMRCLDLPEAVNHPDRLKYPMRRAGERGENKWERITWEDAYAEIKEKVNKIKEEYGPEHILFSHGTGRNVNWLLPCFAHVAFETPNVCSFGFTGYACYQPRICGAMAPLGDFPIADAAVCHADRYLNPKWKNPEVIVIWGNEPLASNGDGFLGHWLVHCVKMGSKIITIDPRLTWWGARSEYFLPIRPGTDAALACAWLNVIIGEDLYDHEFVEYWCAGFEELAESVKEFTPEWAAEICWLDAEEIRESARLYASGNCSTIQWGLAQDQQVSAMALNLAICDLMAICGNVDRPGGNILMHNAFEINGGYASGTEFIPEAAEANKLTTSHSLGINCKNFIARANPDGILHAIEAGTLPDGTPYPIPMLWMQSSNGLANASMDAPRAYEALKKIDFIVYVDPFLTPTAIACADLVLPVAMSAERNSARTWWTPVRTMQKVCDYYEAKSDEEIVYEVGMLLNPKAMEKLGWTSPIAIVNWYLNGADGKRAGVAASAHGVSKAKKGGCGLTHEELTAQGGVMYDEWNGQYEKYAQGILRADGQVGFNTPTGRIELTPLTYYTWGLTQTPFHTEPPQGPISTPELMEEYPLILSSGGRSFEFFHSEHRQLPTMREFHPWPLLMVSPEDAEKYGIQDGQWTWAENRHGRFKQIACVTPRMRPGMVHAEHGWWFPEQEGAEPSLFGTFDSNPNNCAIAFETGELGIGSAIKSMICKIYPVKDGDTLPGVQVCELGGFGDYIPGEMAGAIGTLNWKDRVR